MESKEAQNDSVTSQLNRTNELSQAQLEVVASFIAGGEVLSLKGHFLTELPDTKAVSKTLIFLDLSFNSFKNLPKEVLRFEKLRYLKLRDNPLVQLPARMNRLQYLKSIVVSFCCLTELPKDL